MTQTIGHFELLGTLGQGGMATVWLARDTRLDREVALKEPCFPKGLSPEQTKALWTRFQKEARAQAKLSAHPNVVQIYGIEEIGNRRFIVMEVVRGETLTQRLQKGPLPPQEALAVASQVLSALSLAHEKHVVHRDIKPDNIFLCPQGAKLADFGIARIQGGGTATEMGTVVGTVGYMAPEQVRGQATDGRTDLFSVGIVLFQMLTGRHPFGMGEETDTVAVTYRIVNDPLPSLGRGDLAWLDPILTAATQKDAAWRIPSAAAFMQALKTRQLPAVPLAGVASTVIEGQEGLGAPQPARTPRSRGNSMQGWIWAVAGLVVVAAVLFALARIGVGTGSQTGSTGGEGGALTVVLLHPTDGQRVAVGTPVPVTVEVTGSAPSPSVVEFLANGARVLTWASAPYVGVWRPTSSGSVRIEAIARDEGGGVVGSHKAQVMVAPAQTPSPPRADGYPAVGQRFYTVVLYSYLKSEATGPTQAEDARDRFRSMGIGDVWVVDTDAYQGFREGVWAVIHGTFASMEASKREHSRMLATYRADPLISSGDCYPRGPVVRRR